MIQTAEPCDVTLSVFSCASGTEAGEVQPMAWPAFVAALREGLKRPVPAPRDTSEKAWQRAKRALPGIVCAPFSGPRGNDTVGDHTAIVLDVDHPSPDTLERLQRYRAVAYESPSSGRKGPNDLRLRVCVAITEPVPPHAVEAARAALAVDLGLDPQRSGVAGADTASQMMFIGRVDGTPERQLWSYDGEPWTPPPPGEAPQPTREDRSSDVGVAQWGRDTIPDLSVLAREIGTLDEHGMRRGGRDVCRAIGGYLARYGYHPDAIEQAVYEQIPSDHPGADERAPAARETAEQFYAGGAGAARAAGYTTLAERFGPDVMTELEDAVTDPWVTMMIAKWPPQPGANDTGPSAPEKTEPAQPAGLWRWVEADELARPLAPVDYHCEFLGFVADDYRPDMIVGPAGYGKTGLAQAYALAIASGKPLFGAHPVKGGVVYHIDNEQGLPATQRRYQMLSGGSGVNLAALRGKLRVFSDGVRLTRGDAINEQAVVALQRNTDGAGLVIIDSLITLGLGIDENAVAFGEVLMRLRDITRKGGPKFLVIHHSGKGESSADGRGSSAIDGERGSTWVGDSGFRWRHRKKSLSDTSGFRSAFVTEWEEMALTFAEARAGKQPSAKIVLADGGGGAASGVPSAAEKRMVAELVNKHPDGVSRASVETALDGRIPQKRLRGVIDTLLSDQALVPHGTGKLSRLVPGPKITEVLA